MIVGHIADQNFVKPITARVTVKIPLTNTTNTFKIKATQTRCVKNFKHWY
jgi:hypothetical protein